MLLFNCFYVYLSFKAEGNRSVVSDILPHIKIETGAN